MGFKKRGAIYSVIALMLCVAVYLNYSYSKEPENLVADSTSIADKTLGERQQTVITEPPSGSSGLVTASATDDYFSEARLSRQKARDEAVNILSGTIDSSGATEEAKTAANMDIQLLAGSAMTESRIENLVIAKGYKDCVVFINDNAVNVIVSKTDEGLSDVAVAKIKDIVLNEIADQSVKIQVVEAS